MKKLFIPIIGAFTLSISAHAMAGPDFQVIEHARKDKQVAQADLRATQPVSRAKLPRCPPAPLVLPLDHGPRAQTTPAENQRRKNRYEAQVKACKEGMK